MATTSPVPLSRSPITATGVAVAGVAVAMAGLIRLGVSASLATTLELIGMLDGSPPAERAAVDQLLDPWGLGILLIGAAMVITATAVKAISRARPDRFPTG